MTLKKFPLKFLYDEVKDVKRQILDYPINDNHPTRSPGLVP